MSGWFCATLIFDNNKTAKVMQKVLERSEETFERPRREENTVKVTLQMNYYLEKVEKLLNEDERVIVVVANDTTDSGYGILYKKTEDGLEEIEKKNGYEGAEAYDVAGYFQDEYDVRPRVHW